MFGLGGEAKVLFGTVGALGTLFAARMLAGAMGGNLATAQAYIADVTPVERRAGALGLVGAAFGVTQGAGSLGRTVGPPVMTALYAFVVYWSPFVVGAALSVGVVALLWTLRVAPADPAASGG